MYLNFGKHGHYKDKNDIILQILRQKPDRQLEAHLRVRKAVNIIYNIVIYGCPKCNAVVYFTNMCICSLLEKPRKSMIAEMQGITYV